MPVETVSLFESQKAKKKPNQNIQPENTISSESESGEHTENLIDLNKELLGNKSSTFLMKVNSNVMKESGISNGDIIIIDRSLKAVNGKVVVALVSGDLLIRRFEKINNRLRLVPDTSTLSAMEVDNNFEGFSICGVVTYVIHKA